MPDQESILLAHAASTLFMTGLIWLVQAVHYPLFALVGAASYSRFHVEHMRRTTWVVGPPMLIELATALILVVRPPDGVEVRQVWTGLLLLTVIWLSTALLQVPQHRRLASGFDADAHQRLVTSNWIRSVAWSLRALLAIYWVSIVV